MAGSAILAVLLVGTDVALQRSRVERLLSTVAAAERTSASSTARVAAVVRYASPQLDGAGTPPAVQRSLEQLVEQAAAQALPALRLRLRAVEATAAPPWRPSLRRAKASCLAYLRARVRVLLAVSTSYDALAARSDEVAVTRELARAELGSVAGPERAKSALPSSGFSP